MYDLPIEPSRNLRLGTVATLSVGLLLLFGAVTVEAANEPGGQLDALADLSLEELGEIRVYSASRRLEPANEVPAAIFVITSEDLDHYRVTNLPDALRLVPGVEVGQVDANKWAVSMRGFNSREANKLLVLVDGRSIYDPLFSGMLWESHDFMLEDIDRIEVIRGPGGTLWGANAFNGVINIITKHSSETNGTFASVTSGSEDPYIVGFRHGWSITDRQSARVYVQGHERDTGYSEPDEPADDSRDLRGGFRWDWRNDGSDQLRISGDVFDTEAGIRETPTLAHDVSHSGNNILARWSRELSDRASLRLQYYYDHVDYDSVGFVQDRTTHDIEFQQTLDTGKHLVVWGGNYRKIDDFSLSKLSGFIDVLPADRNDELVAAFVQDTISLVPDKLRLVTGLKHEESDYADAQWLPNLRLAWTPDADRMWWAAVSRATRVPSRLEADLTFFGTIRIGDELEAEEVVAYEMGYRQLAYPDFWYDIAIFYNDYDQLATGEAGGTLRNLMGGHTQGLEVATRWNVTPRFRLDTSYTFLDMNLALDPASTASPSLPSQREGLAARHQLSLRANVDVASNTTLDAALRFVDELETIDVPHYTALDLAVSWTPSATWELSITGRNLLDDHHPEQDFAFSGSGMPTEIERSVYVHLRWWR